MTIQRRRMTKVLPKIGPFSDLLMAGTNDHLKEAVTMLAQMEPLNAVRLILACTLRDDSVIDTSELSKLAEHLGVFVE